MKGKIVTVRRMFDAIGHSVLKLKRERYRTFRFMRD